MKRWNSPHTDEIADTLLRGGVLLLPTDTIYGIHALAADRDAVGKIYEIKKRESDKPLIVIAASADDLRSLGVLIPANIPLEELWPGPVTIILPLTSPIAASRGALTLACRVPEPRWLRELLARTGPLASTSANRAGKEPAISPADLPAEWSAQLDGILDLGHLSQAASAIFDLSGPVPRLVREGEPVFTQKLWKTLRNSLCKT